MRLMGNLLYLVHRLPFPPNKGDKVRSYHLLKHLAQRHRVFLGTFVDDSEDLPHVPKLQTMCADVYVARLHPRWAKLRSLLGLLTHQALGLQYYRNAGLQAWVDRTLAEGQIDTIVIFSSVMAQYIAIGSHAQLPPVLVDFVDVDSAKWTQYADNHIWPLSWLYRREGERLLAFERKVAAHARHSFFVTDNEAALFRSRAPECADRVDSICNGVDASYFSPNPSRVSPFPLQEASLETVALVFTGAMDYWPNIDAVTWFAREVLPLLQTQWPQLCFYIVGRNPPASVLSLASFNVVVTGSVPDVRPYLQYATLVVAPLRIARGIQNKILEAMAMARPVVASRACAEAIAAIDGAELAMATEPKEFADQIDTLLRSPERATAMGQTGREHVVNHYSWHVHLQGIDKYLTP